MALILTFAIPVWHDTLDAYLAERETLIARLANERGHERILFKIVPGLATVLVSGSIAD